MTRKNPNSSIRSGYKYEDLYVLQLCVEWLNEPDKFKGIKIQYAPDGAKGFAIDDVVIQRNDDGRNFYQLKHKQNPSTDKWDFTQLIEKGLLRWIDSYATLNGSPQDYCNLVTNGEPADDVLLCLVRNKLDWTKIGQHYPEIEKKIRLRFPDNVLLQRFFANFQFTFNHPGKKELEEKLRTILYDDLKVTKSGVDSLLLFIGDEGTEQHPKVITLHEIRAHLSWDNPRPLNQNFHIPVDFEFFDRHTHQQILSDLKNPDGGTKIFIGKPGAGKSTYLSKLYDVLEHDKVAVFRHHYHLNPKDHSQFERLNTDRVKEALRAAFKKEKSKVLDELGRENTEHTPLRDFISKIATYYAKQDKTFVLIIDGLDHVIREGNSEAQLQEFITEIFYPQKGYWLLLGTQEMAINCLPGSIFKVCPEETWIEIKGLSKPNVAKIIKATFKQANKNKNEKLEKDVINKVFDITSGNPLHLRYVLGEISNHDGFISTYDLERIPPYKGDIKTYYEDIWRNLSDLAKTFCFAITALDFKLHKEQLIQLGSYLTPYPAEVTKCFKEIRHLVLSDLSGISVYHNSFMVFMKEQPELHEQQLLLYRNIKSWLNDYNDENLKWSELAKIEYYLGNPTLLLSIDKEWLITSYLQCKDEDQIQNLLDLATEAAFKANDLRKVIFLGEISLRFEKRSYSLWDDNLNKIWVTSFRNNPGITIKYPDFSRLTFYQIKELLIALKDRGMLNEIPEAAIDRMNQLFQDHNSDISKLAKSWLEILLNFENTSDQRIMEFLKQFRKGERSEIYFAYYVNKILENKEQFGSRLIALFKSKLTDQEKKSIKRVLIQHDLRNGRFDWKEKIEAFPGNDNHAAKIYNFLSKQDLSFEMVLKPRSEFPDKYDYASSTAGYRELWLNHFYNSLFLGLTDQSAQIGQWLKLKDDDKQAQLLKAILQVGQEIAKCFNKKTPVVITDTLKPLSTVPELNFDKDYSIFELRRSVIPDIIDQVIWLAHVFNTHHGFNAELRVEEIKSLTRHSWYYQSHLFELLHEHKTKLSTEAFSFFAEQELNKLNSELIDFSDKTERMVNLAILAADLNNTQSLNLLLYRAAENLIAYSNHKDMLLYDILLGIGKLNNAGSEKCKDLLRQIAPYVYHIDKLTDGDETGSFIHDYSSQLAIADVPALYNFYLLSLQKRDYYLSESLFGDILKTLDFSDRISRAIGATAVGDTPYQVLAEIAAEDPLAGEVLTDIHNSFGQIDYGREPNEKKLTPDDTEGNHDEIYSQVTAQNLQEHLRSIHKSSFRSARYERSSFLLNWTKYWLEKSDTDKHQTLVVLKQIIQQDLVETEHELLDYLYPYAKNIDREFAFQCICWAQSNNSGWASDYFSRPDDARNRWKKVIADFPLRIHEFFTVSISNSGLRYNKTGKKSYAISAPKPVQFFIDAGQLQKAEEITEHYIQLLPSLFPNVHLPEPEFYTTDTKVELFDILLKRLEWVSPIVKERASKQLVDILCNDTAGIYHHKYFAWLGQQFLESRACEGLIVLLLSVQKENSCSRIHVTGNNLGALLNIRCMATDLITDAIGRVLHVDFRFEQIGYVAMSFGKTSRSKAEFEELVGRNLPLIYLDYMEELQENCPFKVWACWNTLFDDYCDIYELEYNRDDEKYSNDFNKVMIGRATIFTEILRSTFFKILDYLYHEGIIGIEDLFTHTIHNFTIEPSIWPVEPGNKPTWWPKVKTSSKVKYDEAPPKLDLDITQLLSAHRDYQLLSLNGALPHTDNFYHSNYFYGLEILPFAFSGNWNNRFEASKVFLELNVNAGIWYPAIKSMQNFGVFSNELKFINSERSTLINDHGIIPLIAPVRSLNTNIFQYYRTFYRTRLLSPILKGNLELRIDDSCLNYIKQKESIGSYHDFLDGLRDATDMPELLPYNSFLLLKKDYLSQLLKDKNLNLAFAVKTTLYTIDKYGRSNNLSKTDEYLLYRI